MEIDEIKINTVEDFNRWAHQKTLHPAVSTFIHPECVKVDAMRHYYGLYLLVLTDFRHLYPGYVPKGRVLLWNPDFIAKSSGSLIIANIELLLSYCQHFYKRQFKSHSQENDSLLSKLESLINNNLASDEPRRMGTPNVNFCAERLNMSPSYFSDLIKMATGGVCFAIYPCQDSGICQISPRQQ